MATKDFFNSIDSAVSDHLTGIVLGDDSLQLIENVNAVVRRDFLSQSQQKHVFLISGGGAGHEPMFAGFVGRGLLSAAISGDFFASPSMGQIVKTVETICTRDDEILFIVANYTGDRLNFGLAKENLAQKGFQKIEMFVFGDDISQLLNSTQSSLGQRRGLAGIDFLIRIAGQASEAGKNLNEILTLLNEESSKICTISVSLTPCEIPGVGASFRLEDDQIELGLGIHGEPGVQRTQITSAKIIVAMMLDAIFRFYNRDILLRHENYLAILINNLGSMTQMELNIVRKEIIEQIGEEFYNEFTLASLESRHVMTSFNMKGFSLSAYLVDSPQFNQFWHPQAVSFKPNLEDFILKPRESDTFDDSEERRILDGIVSQSVLIGALESAAASLKSNRDKLNECDAAGGDSDCGTTMARLAQLILDYIEKKPDNVTFGGLARIVSNRIGGTSGAIYGLLFFFASDYLRRQQQEDGRTDCQKGNQECKTVGIEFWFNLLQFCTRKLSEYSGAQRDDRTMIDVLWALQDELEKLKMTESQSMEKNFEMLKKTLIDANDRIAALDSKAGRAANVDQFQVKKEPDPGSMAVMLWASAIVDFLQSLPISQLKL